MSREAKQTSAKAARNTSVTKVCAVWAKKKKKKETDANNTSCQHRGLPKAAAFLSQLQHRQTNRQTDRQTDRHTHPHGQTDRQTGRQTHRHTDTQTDTRVP